MDMSARAEGMMVVAGARCLAAFGVWPGPEKTEDVDSDSGRRWWRECLSDLVIATLSSTSLPPSLPSAAPAAHGLRLPCRLPRR